MKTVLKLSLIFSFLILSYATAFAQDTCGEIVPFASEPRVENDSCCVTYEMDLSLGVNWILHPGNGLPQSETVTSANNNGSNIVEYCYETTQGVIYPNISYYDENWKDVCSSFYPITLDCVTCGLASDIVVDGCCVSFEVHRVHKTKITFYKPDGSFNGAQLMFPLTDGSTTLIEQCRDEPGVYSFKIECFNEDDDVISSSTHEFTIGDDCKEEEPKCGFDSGIEVDGCCVTFSVHTGYTSFVQLFYTDNDPTTSDTPANIKPVSPNNPNPTEEITFCPPSVPYDFYILISCYEDGELVFTHQSHVFHIGECDEMGGPRSDIAGNEALVNGDATINVFPNPASDLLTINTPNQAIQDIQLFDISNRLLLNRRLNEDNSYNLDLSPIQVSGVYYLRVRTNEGFYNKKVVIQK